MRRNDFLRSGTLAKGSAESGLVEAYMCAKVKRNPLVQNYCAEYLGYFTSSARARGGGMEGPVRAGGQMVAWGGGGVGRGAARGRARRGNDMVVSILGRGRNLEREVQVVWTITPTSCEHRWRCTRSRHT